MRDMPSTQGLQPRLVYGRVCGCADGAYLVATDAGERRCERAAACLVHPVSQDMVLLSLDDAGNAWILSVLFQPDRTRPLDVQCDRPVCLTVRGGLTLKAQGALACSGEQIAVDAREARVRVDNISFVGRVLVWQMERLYAMVSYVEQVFGKLTRRLKDPPAAVEPSEQGQRSGFSPLKPEGRPACAEKKARQQAG